MLRKTNTVLETLRAVQQFLDDNTAAVGPGLDSSRRSLDDAATNLAAYVVHQDGGARGVLGATQKLRALRTGLRFDHMRPIAEIAKRKLPAKPEFMALKLPLANVSTAGLIAAAQAMADTAALHAQTFIDLGLAPDFIARLRASANELIQTMGARSQHRLKRSGATTGLAAEDKQGRSIIKLLDSLVRPRIRSNATLIGAWNAAIRSRKTPKTIVPAINTPGTADAPAAGSTSATTHSPNPA